MKRGTARHPKLLMLEKFLQVSRCMAVGIVEGLWDLAAEWHDDGAVGRFSDDKIALAIGYPGDAKQLIRGLLSSEFLDEIEAANGRLVIHDWLSHCPNHVWSRVSKRIRRAGDGAPIWQRMMFEKARLERNRDGGGDSGSEDDSSPTAPADRAGSAARSGGADSNGSGKRHKPPRTPPPSPPPPGSAGECPEASGDVRLRPATSAPDPRPKTQDLNASDLKSEGGGGSESPAGDPPPAPPSPARGGALEFQCVGRVATWTLTADHVGELIGQWPSVEVEACLANLAERQRREGNLRRPAADMPGYLQTWLAQEMKRRGRFLISAAKSLAMPAASESTVEARTRAAFDARERKAAI